MELIYMINLDILRVQSIKYQINNLEIKSNVLINKFKENSLGKKLIIYRQINKNKII